MLILLFLLLFLMNSDCFKINFHFTTKIMVVVISRGNVYKRTKARRLGLVDFSDGSAAVCVCLSSDKIELKSF